jgi:mono/diheme cytochrome c family protein
VELKSWRTAALCIATIALLSERWTSIVSLCAQDANRPERQHVIPALDGPTLFMTYCAVCHGQAADGRGPMAPILKTGVPDLTRIAKRNGDVFPLVRVQNIIAGTEARGLGHGTRQMPVWGPLFSQITSDRDYGKVRLHNVAKYLESLQKH